MSRRVCKEIIDHGVALATALTLGPVDGPGDLLDALNSVAREAAGAVTATWAADDVPATLPPPPAVTLEEARRSALTMLWCCIGGIAFHGPTDPAADFEPLHKAMLGALDLLALPPTLTAAIED